MLQLLHVVATAVLCTRSGGVTALREHRFCRALDGRPDSPVASQAETACDGHRAGRDFRSGLVADSECRPSLHPGPAAGDRAAPRPTHRPGHRAGSAAGADRPQLAQLLETTLERRARV